MLEQTEGINGVDRVRLRWSGHRLTVPVGIESGRVPRPMRAVIGARLFDMAPSCLCWLALLGGGVNCSATSRNSYDQDKLVGD
ncbi:MAG: hypothetical protein ABI746_12255, partial [Dermatophilaceae bacterium]